MTLLLYFMNSTDVIILSTSAVSWICSTACNELWTVHRFLLSKPARQDCGSDSLWSVTHTSHMYAHKLRHACRTAQGHWVQVQKQPNTHSGFPLASQIFMFRYNWSINWWKTGKINESLNFTGTNNTTSKPLKVGKLSVCTLTKSFWTRAEEVLCFNQTLTTVCW